MADQNPTEPDAPLHFQPPSLPRAFPVATAPAEPDAVPAEATELPAEPDGVIVDSVEDVGDVSGFVEVDVDADPESPVSDEATGEAPLEEGSEDSSTDASVEPSAAAEDEVSEEEAAPEATILPVEVEVKAPAPDSEPAAPTGLPLAPPAPSRPTGLPTQPPTGLPVQRPTGLPTQPPTGLPVQRPTGIPSQAPVLPNTEAPVDVAALLPKVAPEQAARMQQTAYVSAGALTAEQLLTGHPQQFAHLDDKIIQVREWVQDYITNSNMANEVALARSDMSKRVEMASMLDRLILQYISKETVVRGPDRQTLIASVIHEILGLGPIEPLWSDPRITEVMVNGPTNIYAEIGGTVVKVPGCRFRDQAHLLEVCGQILAPLNRSITQKNTLEDGRLPDGSRVNVVHQASAPSGPLLTIRRFPETVWTLLDLVKNGSLDEDMACELAWLIYYKCSTVVVGGTGSGKTSLLNAMSSCIPRSERIITVEDSLELRLHPDAHVAAMEGRPPAPNGEGEITIRRLVKNALRMRPDRVVVGEVRDGSALDMLQAMNTGHEGSLTTVHANGAEEAVNRLAVLVAQGGDIPEDKVSWLIGDAVDLMVIQRRYEDGSRRVSGIFEVPSMNQSTDGRLHPIPLWEWEQSGTDDDHRVVGTYVQKNEISSQLRRLRRLDNYPKFTMADVERMSELPDYMVKGN